MRCLLPPQLRLSVSPTSQASEQLPNTPQAAGGLDAPRLYVKRLLRQLPAVGGGHSFLTRAVARAAAGRSGREA